jgi:hypothetical protein
VPLEQLGTTDSREPLVLLVRRARKVPLEIASLVPQGRLERQVQPVLREARLGRLALKVRLGPPAPEDPVLPVRRGQKGRPVQKGLLVLPVEGEVLNTRLSAFGRQGVKKGLIGLRRRFRRRISFNRNEAFC